LTLVGANLTIEANPGLVSLDGLQNLREVEEEATIFGNAVLASLDGLENLTLIGQNPRSYNPNPRLSVERNPLLPQCEVDAFHARLLGDVEVYLASSGNDEAATCP
jgi:hypothetical protein